MATTNLLTFHQTRVRASASSADNHTTRRISLSSSPPSVPANWWSPIFGWSSDPNYIDTSSSKIAENRDDSVAKSDEIKSKPAKSRISRRSLTAEKSHRLQMMTTDTESFHDVMYHSAIASRLASDFSCRSVL